MDSNANALISRSKGALSAHFWGHRVCFALKLESVNSKVVICKLMIQVARAILENPKDETKIYLIYANVTADDILLKVSFLSSEPEPGMLVSTYLVI